MTGFEMGTPAEATSNGSATVQSTTKRTGTNALRVNASFAGVTFTPNRAASTLVNFCKSVRFYLRIATLPSATMRIASAGLAGGTTQIWLMLTSGGALALGPNLSTIWATSGSTMSADGQFHRIDLDCGWNSGGGARASVDGSVFVTDTANTSTVTAHTSGSLGPTLDSGSLDLYFDDVVWYDGALPATLNDYNVGLLLPSGDNAVGNWKRNDGVTAISEWDSVNNVPPTGTAVTSVIAANYIQNGTAASGVAADRIDLGTQAYTNLSGLTDASQVKAVMAIANGAQQVTTGSPKSGSMTTYTNPANGNITTFDYGLPSGNGGSGATAQGAFPTGWGTEYGPVLENPTVTVSSGAGVRVARTGTYTRVISLDFVGVYVLWEALASTITPARLQGAQFAVQRAANY